MNQARFYFFELVRFFADVNDLTNTNVAPLQQADSLFSTRFSSRIGALRPRMKRIFTQNIAIRLDACNAPTPVEALRRNSVMLSSVLIDPGHLQPAARIQFIWRDQMKLFRVNPRRMPELLHMA